MPDDPSATGAKNVIVSSAENHRCGAVRPEFDPRLEKRCNELAGKSATHGL